MARLPGRLALLLPLLCMLGPTGEAAGRSIDVTDFADAVVDRGGEMEDWRPAFQAAIALARQEMRPIYVPAGEYKIRRPITILPVKEPQNVTQRNAIRIAGDGQNHTIISQQVETENVIDWTGLTYEEPCNFGHISDVGLVGGAIALNIKWHNYFTMDSCYIHGAH